MATAIWLKPRITTYKQLHHCYQNGSLLRRTTLQVVEEER